MKNKKNLLLNQMELFDMITSAKLTPNQYYILCCMHDSVSPIRMNFKLELRSLLEDKWLSVKDDKYVLEPKTYTLIKKIEKLFKIQKKKTSIMLMDSNYKEKILAFKMIFPNVKLPSGRAARSATKNLETAFRWFFEHHEYSWDNILAATEKYVDEYEMDRKYMTCSLYFIRKQISGTKDFMSKLADYCEFVISGGEDDDKPIFHQKVV
jgi:hypothetical protein